MSAIISVKDFIHTKYREYWEYANKGKNAIIPEEQLPEVSRRVIYSAYKLGIKTTTETKTVELSGECAKIHPHGDSSIQDSIKAIASVYKMQPATRMLKGIGNFGSVGVVGGGAAARYTSVSGTPLLETIYKDLEFVPYTSEETGISQPEYISCPLPMALIDGTNNIGIGKATFIAERPAREIINWIDALRKSDFKDDIPVPAPTSYTGCEVFMDDDYACYKAVMHTQVDIDDINKKGKYDIITALPPGKDMSLIIEKIRKSLPQRNKKNVMDGSGANRPVYIVMPHGYITEKDFTKFNLYSVSREQPYIWNYEHNTMELSTLKIIAEKWFKDRCSVVTKRLNKEISDIEKQNHKINLIKIFADNHMIDWDEKRVIEYFLDLDKETGESDAKTVLNCPARTFLPDNISANEIIKNKNIESINKLNNEIKSIGDIVIEEAYDIISKQENYDWS